VIKQLGRRRDESVMILPGRTRAAVPVRCITSQ